MQTQTHIKKHPIEINFTYLGKKKIYGILRHAAYFCFIFHKMLFYLFLFK